MYRGPREMAHWLLWVEGTLCSPSNSKHYGRRHEVRESPGLLSWSGHISSEESSLYIQLSPNNYLWNSYYRPDWFFMEPAQSLLRTLLSGRHELEQLWVTAGGSEDIWVGALTQASSLSKGFLVCAAVTKIPSGDLLLISSLNHFWNFSQCLNMVSLDMGSALITCFV